MKDVFSILIKKLKSKQIVFVMLVIIFSILFVFCNQPEHTIEMVKALRSI